MSPKTVVHEVGTVRIGDYDYRLVRTDDHKEAWTIDHLEEPPWESGTPGIIGVTDETWHLGGFKSREGIPGTTEYGTTDDRWPFQMLPGPKVNTVTLTGSDYTPVSVMECLGYVWILTNHHIFRVHPTTLAVTLSKALTPSSPPYDRRAAIRWENDVGLFSSVTSDYLWKVTAIGSPDTWASAGIVGNLFASSINRLFKVDGGVPAGNANPGLLKNISTGLDPMVETNYADRIQCGRKDTYTNALVAFGNSVLVGKPEGLFGISADEGVGVPLIRRMAYDADNCYGMAVVEPYVLVPHKRGLYRLQPGLSVESAGLEREILNSTIISKGRFKWFAADGQWVYAGLEGPAGVNSYVMVGRDVKSGESSLGPIIWDTFIDLGVATLTRAGWVSAITSQPTLWFGVGNNVAYIKLPVGGGPPGSDCEFAASNVRYTPRYHFDDWNSKDFPKVEMAARGVSGTRYWNLAYSIDGGAFVTTDKDTVDMKVDSEGVYTFFFAPTAVGRQIQYRFTYTGPDGDNAPAPIVYFRRYAVPQAKKLPVVKALLLCSENIRHDRIVEQRTAIQQFNDLVTYSEQAASVVSSGPWVDSLGGSANYWVRNARLVEVMQEGESEPELLVEASLQKREVA